MSTSPHPPHRRRTDDEDAAEPGALPVEPDQGPAQPLIPLDPEHERMVDPQA